jgi:hypothetical protein
MVEDWRKIAEALMKKNLIQNVEPNKREEPWQIKGNLPVNLISKNTSRRCLLDVS